jgi:hypothetical protein
MSFQKIKFIAACLVLLLTAISAMAQTTSFSYQGRLNNGGMSANGQYDLQFRLYDAIAGGMQIGATVLRPTRL